MQMPCITFAFALARISIVFCLKYKCKGLQTYRRRLTFYVQVPSTLEATRDATILYPHCTRSIRQICDIVVSQLRNSRASPPFCLHQKISLFRTNLLIIMASSTADAWDEGAFIDDISRHPELFNISNELYSNNEHRRYIFRQIGVTFNIDGEKIFLFLRCISRLNTFIP